MILAQGIASWTAGEWVVIIGTITTSIVSIIVAVKGNAKAGAAKDASDQHADDIQTLARVSPASNVTATPADKAKVNAMATGDGSIQ